jgi:hypothetical protein
MPARTSLHIPKQKFELSSAKLIGDMMDGASTPRQMRREGGGIESDGEIERLHASLTTRFDGLRAVRGDASLYLLEHDLASDELDGLLRATGSSLSRHRVEGAFWMIHALPLLVAATEVGYAYRGTGTDFWPIFAERFGDMSIADRAALSSLFRRATGRFGLAEPPDTPWNHAFCHIAWPVLHAILPIELHRPLARALRDVRAHLDVTASDAALIAPIRNRAQLAGGVRLIAWLEDHRTAAAVVRQFLDPTGQHAIATSALARIAADLARDETANTALREARKRQKALETQPARRSRRRTSAIETRFAPLVLRSLDQRWSLALKIPQMDQATREQARSALDAIRWRALLWSQGRPVPGRNIFSDFPVPLGIDVLPPSETALFGELSALPLSQEAKEFLGSLRVQTEAPLLFSDVAVDGDAVQLLSATVTDSSGYILLVGPDQQPSADAQHLGRIAGLRAFRVDAGNTHDAAWLSRLGFSVRQSVHFAWIGLPEVEQHRPNRRFRLGDYLAFEMHASGRACEAQLTEPDGTRSRLEGTGQVVAGFTADKLGAHTIRLTTGETVGFEVISLEDETDLLTVDIDAGSGAIGDLASRAITLRFDSGRTLQEAEVELELICDGRSVGAVRDVLADTPCRLDGDHPIWDALLTSDVLERLLMAHAAEMCVSVRGLVAESFRFEQVMAPFAWQQDGAGRLTATDEAGELALYAVTPERPLQVAPADGSTADQDIMLFRAGHNSPLQAGGLCIGPKVWRPADAPAARAPGRLLRQFEGGRADMPDGRSTADALIAWSAARVDHPVTQFRRAQIVRQLERWLVEQYCGSEWAEQEGALAVRRETSFPAAFLTACARLRIGYADVGLSRGQGALLDRILLRLIGAHGLPISLETSREPIEDELSVALDEMFNEAYVVLAEDIESVGDYCPFDPDEDIDVGETSDNWDRALRAAATQAALIELVDLLRPLEPADALSLADFETMLPDDVIDLLHDWIGNNRPPHHARNWSRDLVESAYWLLAKPAVAARLPWRGAAERLLADRFSARAIRYAALRAGVSARVE